MFIRNRVFMLSAGYDIWRDRPFHFCLTAWPRPELMTRADEGRYILCLFRFEITWGPNFYFWSDVPEIADRLANRSRRGVFPRA